MVKLYCDFTSFTLKDSKNMNSTNKDSFRQDAIKKLKSNFGNKIKIDKFIVNNLLSIIKNGKYNNILLYIPLKIEVNIKPLINILRRQNINIYVPYMISSNRFKIVPYKLPLNRKKYNIFEPNNGKIYFKIKLDLAIVPIIGFDDSFRRIGFGVGFYDRFFSSLNYKVKTIFTQRYRYKSNNIITNNYDVKADYIITNKGIERI